MSASPNFEGFADAQARLRENFGHDLSFFIPALATWPAGVELDPETGEPYDPTIEPETGGDFAAVTVKAAVVSRPMGLSRRGIDDSTKRTAIGWMEEGGIVLIVDADDWSLIEDATEVEYADERYTIRQTDHDYLGPVDRYLLYAAQQ